MGLEHLSLVWMFPLVRRAAGEDGWLNSTLMSHWERVLWSWCQKMASFRVIWPEKIVRGEWKKRVSIFFCGIAGRASNHWRYFSGVDSTWSHEKVTSSGFLRDFHFTVLQITPTPARRGKWGDVGSPLWRRMEALDRAFTLAAHTLLTQYTLRNVKFTWDAETLLDIYSGPCN